MSPFTRDALQAGLIGSTIEALSFGCSLSTAAFTLRLNRQELTFSVHRT